MGKTLPDSSAQARRAQIRGQWAEDKACEWLQHRGMKMLARNCSYRGGEIDLVMREHNTLVFVEVRYRSSQSFGGASASVDRRKQARIRHAAHCFLQDQFGNLLWPLYRFDLVLIEAGKLSWIPAAF